MNNINNSRFFKKTIQKAIKKRAIQPNCQHIKYSPYIEKSNSTLKKINQLICVSLVFTQPLSALAYEVTQDLEVGVISTAVIQFANFNNVVTDGGEERNNASAGSYATDFWINMHPTKTDEFHMTLSYAVGNGLNSINPFTVATYADDLEDDLKNINGRNRDYLLESWYKHTLEFGTGASLGVTVGIIDSSVYMDGNTFANCEVTQFMNDTFVNSPLLNLPSYDGGSALEFESGNWQIKAVVMNSRNEAEQNYMYYGGQAAYTLESDLGEGHFRLNGHITSADFTAVDTTRNDESLKGIGFSVDQELTDHLGVFTRIGWQDDAAAIDHDQLYSGGVNINGKAWGRAGDDVGIGYAYLKGARASGLDNTQVFETYVRFAIFAHADFTFDIQYILNKGDRGADDSPEGTIIGGRLSTYF